MNSAQFGKVPIVGQQQRQMQASLQAAIGQLSLSIYNQLATGHIATLDAHQTIDRDRLRQLARDANVAARCYFEGMGVIEANPGGDQ